MQPLTTDQSAFIVSVKDRVKRVAESYAATNPRFADEIASAAARGVIKATTKVGETNNVGASWAATCAKNEVLNFLRSRRAKHEQSWRQGDVSEADEPACSNWGAMTADVDGEDSYQFMMSKLDDEALGFAVLTAEHGLAVGPASERLGLTRRQGKRIATRIAEALREYNAA